MALVTPEKKIKRGWSPSPLAVRGYPSPSKMNRRLEKAASALAELKYAMSGTQNNGFHEPEPGFAKKRPLTKFSWRPT